MTVGPGVGTPQNNDPYGKRLKGLPTLGTREPVPGHGTGTKWCCVHSLSTWYVTVYIITVFIRLTALGAY